jgi:hypothetical protein
MENLQIPELASPLTEWVPVEHLFERRVLAESIQQADNLETHATIDLQLPEDE